MYLKSVTLKGFKSFAHSTTFAFEPGVTAIVGPNGSGKSNVVDALAWVMGEQGAKTLRGGKMEDVIFAGTSSRGPLGRAEVSLTIDNTDGALPIEYTEVTISRTLFRNGQSEYAINGQTCRLLDVQELLSDSGLGRQMHVIVGQGRLDAVLQASPEERRGFIEEAAGILKHRRRKEKSLRKLESMEANLTRLGDLAGEIRRQLRPLGRQAEVAREAQTIAAEVRDARARIIADEVSALRADLETFDRSEQERQTERLVLTEQLQGVSARIARLEASADTNAVDAARATLVGLEAARERIRGLFTLANQRISLLSGDVDLDTALTGVTVAEIESARDALGAERVGLDHAEQELVNAEQITRNALAGLAAVDAQLAEQTALISQFELDRSALAGRVDAALTRAAAVADEYDRAAAAHAAAHARLATTREEVAEAEADAKNPADAKGLDTAYISAGERVAGLEAKRDDERARLHEAERRRDALSAQIRALSRALETQDGSTRILNDKVGGARGRVADEIAVSAGFEGAIAAALGPLADAVVVAGVDEGLQVLEQARLAEAGQVNVVVAKYQRPAVKWPEIPGLTPARRVVTGPDGVVSLLSTVGIVDTLETARAVVRALPGDFEPTLVTLSGDVVSQHQLRGGSGRPPGRIELRAELEAAELDLSRALAEAAAAADGLARANEELGHALADQAAALSALRSFDAQSARHAERLSRVRGAAEAAASEIERLTSALTELESRRTEARAEADRLSDELERVDAAPRPLFDPHVRAAVADDVEKARGEELIARLNVQSARERVRARETALDSLEERARQAERQATEARLRAEQRERQRRAAAAVVGYLPEVLSSVERSVTAALAARDRAENERSAHITELAELRREEARLRETMHALSESVHGLELQIYEKKLHLSTLLDRAATELGLSEEVLLGEFGPQVELANGVPFVRAEQLARLRANEAKLEQLGKVNPLALEEFAALEQRHNFLSDQLRDLTQTRADLLQIIRDLDQTMQGIFSAAFEDTRAAFAEVFPILFPGGTGDISLTDPDSPLTTGIDVSVRPAGKKIERLSLLSGGERSLAAVALLVAIFKARPSPFYIMDEVEAALDDANLGRLLGVFDQLRAASQLIIVTHQKRTMEIADALYGVSMRQDGVSAVVGQRVRAEMLEA